MDRSTQSSATASDYYTIREEVKKKGKNSEKTVRSKRCYQVNYTEANVDGQPEEELSRMEKYRRELARTRQRMRKIPLIYLNTFDTVISFLLISTLIWLARQLVH